VAVRHQLPGCGARRGDPQTVNHIIQTALEQLQQVLTGDTAQTSRSFVSPVELFFLHTVNRLSLLFFEQLRTVFGYFLAFTGKSVLSRGIVLLLKRLIRPENCLAELSGDFCFWSYISSHC